MIPLVKGLPAASPGSLVYRSIDPRSFSVNSKSFGIASKYIVHPHGPAVYVKALPSWTQWQDPSTMRLALVPALNGSNAVFGIDVAYSMKAITATIDRGLVKLAVNTLTPADKESMYHTHAAYLAAMPGWDALARQSKLRPLVVPDVITAMPFLLNRMDPPRFSTLDNGGVLGTTLDPGAANLTGLLSSYDPFGHPTDTVVLTLENVTAMAQADMPTRISLIRSTIMAPVTTGYVGGIFLVLDANHWFPAIFYAVTSASGVTPTVQYKQLNASPVAMDPVNDDNSNHSRYNNVPTRT